jgi:hypothetical protein
MTGRRVAPDDSADGRCGTVGGERVQIANRQPVVGLVPRGRLGSFDNDGVSCSEVDRVGVVVFRLLGRLRRLRIRLWGVIVFIVMMVMTAGAGAVSVVAVNGDRVRVDVRSLVVSVRLALAMCVTECCCLRQQQARQQRKGHNAMKHDFLFDTKHASSLTILTMKTRATGTAPQLGLT